MNKKAVAGNAGPKIRSDCEVTLTLKRSGGITIKLISKVKSLYGKSIEKQCVTMLRYFGIPHAEISITDSGALPFVIAARIEAAVRKTGISCKEYLPEMMGKNCYPTERDRFRFSRLYLPGNNPGLMINAGLHSADGIILDLEDSVAPEKKDEARLLVRNALRQIDFRGAERMVRINQGEAGLGDIDYVIPHCVNLILIPKCERREEVIAVERKITVIRKKLKLADPVWLMPIIETAEGIENCYEIVKSSSTVVAVAIGLEDYTADIGVQRTQEAGESLYARTRLVNAAKAAKIQPIDSVFSDVADMEGLKNNVMKSKSLGFEGMGCIHPRQITVIKNGYSPLPDEIEKAKRIFLAFEEARLKGLGVVSLGSKMIDPPVVARAQKTITLAVSLGLLPENWQENEGSPWE